MMENNPHHTLCLSHSSEPTGPSGGEHDDERLPVEDVCPAGLTAVIVGVVLSHRHCLLPEKKTSATNSLCVFDVITLEVTLKD